MKTNSGYFRLVCTIVFTFYSLFIFAQSPGGVSTGATRGWKIEHFDGDFNSNLGLFGLGSGNTTPGLWGYTGYINGSEFIGYDGTYFGLQYSGTLEVPQTGSYSFNVYNIDDHASLYIDGVQKALYTWSGAPGNITATVNLTSGDHTILLKFINNGGPGVVNIRWSGPGITSNSDLDGRYVRSDNTALAGWYKGADVSITANFSGTTARLNGFTNKAPSFSGNGNLTYRAGLGWNQYDTTRFNYNAGGIFDGDDGFISAANQNGLSFRSAPRTVFLIANYSTNLTAAQWLWGQSAGDGNTTNGTGIYKSSGTQTAMGRSGNTNPLVTSTYTANEPKLITGDITLGTGDAASVNNNRSTSANGGTAATLGFTERISNYNNNCCALEWGNTLSSFTNGAGMPELIYYPFELTANQRQRVNTYLAIKYGITLQHNYLNTSGTVLWDITSNATYSNRIFGIGRELAAEALNQKQSQSQMTSATGYDFLTVAKGSIATTNASNTGVLADGDYVILGDNNGALASQSTGIPTSFITASGGCTTARLTRQWKVQTAGSPGGLTIRAGSSGFLFPSLAAGLAVMVDIDGDGNFTTGTVNTYPASSNSAGIATFPNVTIPNGAVISFAWVVTSPGGVSTGLALWLKADAGTSSTTSGAAITTWVDQSANATGTGAATYFNNGTNNYNPYISYNGTNNYFAMPAGYANFTGGLSSYFVASFNNTTQNWVRFFDFGNGSANNNVIFAKTGTVGTIGITGYNAAISAGTTTSTANTVTPGVARIYGGFLPSAAAGTTITGSVYNNGLLLAATGTTTMAANTSRSINYIGRSNWAADDYFSGTHSEDIIYNTVLTATQQKQINSYLAVKYGLTLDVSLASYLASDGTTVTWNKTAYWNNVFGIGRDDCSGLLQKQSKSVVAGDNVAISLGAIAATNAANNGSFTANKQFIIVGNDGASFSTISTDIPASFGGASCNARRYAREWKVQNTGSAGTVTVTIGDAVNKVKTSMTNLQLAVDIDGDGDFTTGTPVLYTPASISNGVATFNTVTLPDGAVFTLCWTGAAPGGVFSPSSGTTSIGGVPHLNGATYKLYVGTVSNYTATLDLSALSVLPGTLSSTGYISDLTNTQNIIAAAATTYMGIEITAKIYIATATSTYQFRANIFDDQACIKIDGTTVANAATYGSGANLTSGNVNLTAGYHDLLIRFGQVAGPVVWDISWNGGSGTTFTAIPAANLFTTFTGPSAWYAADDNTLQANADGADLVATGAFWPDMSVNANNMFGPPSGYNPLYYKTNTTYIRNYNPSVYFSADFMQSPINISGMALGALGKSAVTVAQNAANNTYMTYTSYGVNTNTNLFGLAKRTTNKISLFTLANDVDETSAFYTSATPSTDIIGGTLTNARLATVYANGASRGSATLSAFSTLLYPMYLGVYPGTVLYYTGNMNEVIHYPWALSTAEQQRINSYLSIKWGITLDQTTPTAYLSADGTTTWAADATYKYDITGIARDDCSALNQLQSSSTDGNDIVTISKGALAATNNANTSSFSGSKQFVIFGNDNGTITNLNTTNMPTALSSSSLCYKKIGRVWKVQATGSVGSVQMQLGKTGLFIFNKTYYKPKLLISSSATDWTSATIVDLTSLNNGIAQFDNVTFSGTQYFTIALIQAAPGGVASNLNLWLAADNGPSTTTDNTAVTTWSDLSLQGMNGTGVGSPLYRSGSSTVGINYNPVIGLNGTTQYFTLPNGFADFTAGIAGFSVLNTNFGTVDAYGRFFHAGTSTVSNANGVAWNRNVSTDNITVETWSGIAGSYGTMISSNNPLATTNNTSIHGFRMQAGTASQGSRTGNIYFNGLSTLSSSALTTPTTISRTNNFVGNDWLAELLNGYLPELIIYNRDLSDAERLRVNSYLAVKYGKTLDVSLTKYVNSQDATIYGYTTHWNRITAIGKDDCSALDQRQSKSQETGALVSISADATNGMAASNDLNTVPINAQGAFAVFGDNGKAVSWTGVDNLAGALVRLNRVWRMKETGTVGAVYIEVPGSSSVLTTKLPAGDLATDPVYLVVTSAGNFKGSVTLVEMTPDVFGTATKWKCSYDFADGDYFSFATKKLCLGPSGITDGLTGWYRADNKTTGAIAPTSGTLVDETGTNTLTRNGNGTATVIAGSAISFNYNRTITLATNAAFTKGSLSETALINVNDGSMYGVGTAAANLYMFSNSTTNKTGINAAPIFMAGTGGAFTSNTLPNIYNMNITGGTLSGSQNGTAVTASSVATSLPVAATYSAGIGTYVAGATFNNGSFAEAFSFNHGLTTAEQQVINSYLALKYGQTISHNYLTPDYDGTNAATSTIYDVSTYANRIFGVGIDSTGCFYQKQSTSQLTGSMLKISIATSLATENSLNTATFILDRTYVAAGDDNGAIASWVTGTTPAIYNNSNCAVPTRIVRQWKFKAINKQQAVLITIPDNSSTATTKLPLLPAGATKVYMVVNQNSDLSINSSEEEVAMTLNATTKEWETTYTFPDGTYKYISFVAKPDLAGLQPVIVGTGVQDGTATNCNATPYIYYRGTTNSTNAIIAINPNGNSWSPTSLSVNNQGTLTGGGGTFTNTGTGYYQSTNGTQTLRIAKRLHTVVATGSYTLNDGVTVRVYYADADTTAMLTDAFPGGGSVQRKGWFKYDGSAVATVAAMTPTNLGAAELTPVARGTDQGVKYVEFLVSSFSTFGYFAKTTSAALPVELEYFKGEVIACTDVLNWKSGVEEDFSYFELQYSTDGIQFKAAGIQEAKGSGSTYQLKYTPANANSYYRLKMVDRDGSIKYSSIVALANRCVQPSVRLYPNPVRNYLDVSGIKPGTRIKIWDARGREVINVKANLTKERIQTAVLAHGSYFVEVLNTQTGVRDIFKIIKE